MLDVTVGYTGGTTPDPTYEQVCGGGTGHAEAVEVDVRPGPVSYRQLLDTFWHIHNPTTMNRQGWDLGSQYRSAIFFHDPEQERLARATPRLRAGVARQADRDRDRPGDDLLPRRGVPPALLRALGLRGVWRHDRGALEPTEGRSVRLLEPEVGLEQGTELHPPAVQAALERRLPDAGHGRGLLG